MPLNTSTVLDDLRPYLWPGLIALAVTVLTTPIAKAIAIRGGIMDMPDTRLKPHAKPIPYLGGVAIYVGWASAIVFMLALGSDELVDAHSRRLLVNILVAGTIMMVTGLVDDIVDLAPRTKLALELIAAAILVWGGIGSGSIHVFVDWLHIPMPDWLATTLSALITIAILVGAGNATNLIDGLDGLCSGVTGIIALGFAIIAAHLTTDPNPLTKSLNPVRLIVAFALLGACLGFLRYNFNPAQVFMGDAGSLLLGFNAAVILLLFAQHRGVLRWFLGACMVFSLPVFDTTLAIARRWLNGRPIFAGDRSHFYDQLRDRGLSVRATVLICYAVAIALGAVGCLVLAIRTLAALGVFLGVILLAVLIVIRLGMLRVEPQAKRPPGNAE